MTRYQEMRKRIADKEQRRRRRKHFAEREWRQVPKDWASKLDDPELVLSILAKVMRHETSN